MSGGMLFILALIPAVILHELAHGYVAHMLGDDTAKNAGRLTLNPLKHIDPFGSIVFPLILALGQIATLGRVEFLYGWAKPVPVNPLNLQINGVPNPRRLMAIVAVAGPLTNFALAILAGFVMHAAQSSGMLDFLAYFIAVNLLLGIFNLIPLPPMDGGRIAVGMLPLPLAQSLAGAERYGILLVLLVLFILPIMLAQLGIAFDPFQEAVAKVLPWAERIVLTITGNQVGN
jgi:Zn-dependent protease